MTYNHFTLLAGRSISPAEYVAFAALLVLTLALIWYFWRRGQNTEYTAEIISSDDDPFLQAESDNRANLLAVLLSMIDRTFEFEEQAEQECISMGMNRNRVALTGEFVSARVLCDWPRGRLHVTIATHGVKDFVFKTTVHIRNGFFNENRFAAKLNRWKRKVDKCNMRDGVIDEAIAAAYHIALMDKDQKFYDSLLFQLWDEMKDDLNAKPTQAKMINFSRLSTFLMRQHRDQFVEMLGERLNLTPEDLEENENETHPNEETPE